MSDEEKVQPKSIDINDLSLTTEEVTVDEDADAFQMPPPAPDGIHRAKLKFQGTGMPWSAQPDRSDSSKIGYLFCGIEARIIAPDKPYDNNPVFDGYVSTMIMQSSGTCRVAGVVRALGGKIPSRTTHQGLAKILNDLIAGEPQVRIETRWEGYCETCPGRRGKTGKVVLRGMKKFPEKDGKIKHVVECKSCGTEVTAQARIVRYLSVEGGAQAASEDTATEGSVGEALV